MGQRNGLGRAPAIGWDYPTHDSLLIERSLQRLTSRGQILVQIEERKSEMSLVSKESKMYVCVIDGRPPECLENCMIER